MLNARCLASVLLVLFTGILAGCNLITTADRLSIDYEAGAGGGSAATPNGDNPAVQSSSSGGGNASASVGSGNPGPAGGGASEPMPNQQAIAAPGVSLNRVTINQGVSCELMKGGNEVTDSVPVAASRAGLLRVFYSTDSRYNGQPVVARLTFSGGAVLEQELSLGAESNEAQLGSTINFELPADKLTVGGSYRVDLVQQGLAEDEEPAARFPQNEKDLASLQANPSSKLKIVLVPVVYYGDGSGRQPDVSAGQVEKYRAEFLAMYPVSDVEISVRNPIQWDSTVAPGGSGWSNLLNAVQSVRAQDGADSTTYYYGVFKPAASVQSYCAGGCVQGLGFLANKTSAPYRVAIGIGYSGLRSVEVALHELGHNHGREHAPCGVSGDPSYPHAKGKIGRFGYHSGTKQFFAPNQYADVMSYCDPAWISDYTYSAIYKRSLGLKSSPLQVGTSPRYASYGRYQVGSSGALKKLKPISLAVAPESDVYAEVTLATSSGVVRVLAPYVRYDHLPGGTLLVPPPSHQAKVLSVLQVKLANQTLSMN